MPRDGRALEEHELAGALLEQQGRVTEALQEFADNTLRYLREEGKLLTEGIDFPALETSFRDRHALVVARGPGYKRDLKIVRGYVRDFRPVLVAVDGGRRGADRGGLEAGRDRRRHGLGHRRDAPLGRRDPRPRLPRGPRAGRGAPAAARRAVPHRRRTGDLRGHRAAARARQGRRADRRGRHPLQPGRVPRAEPRRNVLDVRHAAEGGGDPDRRQGRLPARQPADRRLAARPLRDSPRWRPCWSRSWPHRHCGTCSASRLHGCSTSATTSRRSRRCS